jgi:4,5:9,10-diseco-3-hydroxy-5,9,17-trioxoandrosta-1(10),2-diene-4-oate hydrolase
MTNTTSPPHPDERQAYGPAGRSPWLDVDWRDHQHWITVNDDLINVIDLGEGPPIVFIHGLSGSWPNWLEQLPVFAANHRVISFDLPGFGHSPMPREQISISGYARLVDGLLDTLGVDAAAVVGNSMGGFIAAELAISVPQRVERLVLISAAGLSTYGNRGALRAVPVFRRLERRITAYAAWTASKSETVARRRRLREATLGLVVAHPSRLGAALAAEQVRGAGKPGFVDAFEANLNYDFRERLPEIACPTLIVWGDSDRVITVRDAELYEQLIPDSRKVIFKDTGHLTMLERPDAFNALLTDFLSE